MAVILRRPSPGAVTSGFGNRAGGFHEGIDFGWGNGWTITAAAAGVVRWAAPGAGYGARYGNLTIIDHGGFETRYAHQSRIDVQVGQQVTAGHPIGVIGGSGASGPNTYAPHLHFELLVGGKRINPAPHFAAPAGGTIITPIVDEPERRRTMSTVYYFPKEGGTGTPIWALAGDGHGAAAWIDVKDRVRASDLIEVHGRSVPLASWAEWERTKYGYTGGLPALYDSDYKRGVTAPAASAVIDYAELGKALALAVSANAPVPTAQQIARAVNDDAAERLRN